MLERDVMDTYVGLITEDLEKSGITYQIFMSMVASYCVIMNMEGDIEMHLSEPLWTSINKSKLFFPIHHANSNHYYMLIMDNKTRKFIHMNLLRPKKNVKNQVYHQNAKKIIKYIKKWFESIKSQEIKFKEESKVHGFMYTQAQITLEEEECWQWVLSNEIKDYKIEENMSCPQQPCSSVYCGPFVLHYERFFSVTVTPCVICDLLL